MRIQKNAYKMLANKSQLSVKVPEVWMSFIFIIILGKTDDFKSENLQLFFIRHDYFVQSSDVFTCFHQ